VTKYIDTISEQLVFLYKSNIQTIIMLEGKELVEFSLEDGTSFLMEIDAPNDSSLQRVSRGDVGKNIGKATQSFEKSLDQIIPFASTALNRLRYNLMTPADEVELKFGVKMTASAGAVIASVSSDVNFEVTLRWKQPD
jgi:Trypsin-co-occurring domain 1